VIDDYSKLGLGSLNNEIRAKLKHGSTDSLEKNYFKSLNEQLDKAGIKSESLRQNTLKDW
jgi:hypothetical protein